MRTSLVAIAVAACNPAHGDPDPLVFPRLAAYVIDTKIDRDIVARDDLAIVDVEVAARDRPSLDAVRRAQPGGLLLAYLTSEEITREVLPDRPLAAARFARIPPSAWLVEAGSTLVAPIGPRETRLRVADPSRFSLHPPRSPFYGADEPTYLLVDGEHMRLVAIAGDTLVVERGFRSAAAPHAAGARAASHVLYFEGTWMLDIAVPAWRDMLADEAAALVHRGPWNGVFLDVCFEDISWLDPGRVDLDRDGVADEPHEASRRWSAAMDELVDAVRARVGPAVPIVANPGAQDCPHRRLDGILLEGWPTGMPAGFADFATGLERYFAWSRRGRHLTIANGYSPRIGFGTIAAGQDELARTDYRAMRFGLATALLGDGYFAFDNGVFGHYVAWWYDEYDGAGAGPHWLGQAIGDAHRSGNLRWREFEHGVAVVNLGDATAWFAAPAGLAKLAGRQDRAHNDGARVGPVLAVAPHDGYLLRR